MVAFGPFPDGARLDRATTGAAGGVLVLSAIALPVTVATVATSKAVTWWLLALCALAGVVGLALVIKSCQNPRPMLKSYSPHLSSRGTSDDAQINDSSSESNTIPASSSEIVVEDSELAKSSISIPEGSRAEVVNSELTESPLTIRNKAQARPDPDQPEGTNG
jgi:hypothetical protein